MKYGHPILSFLGEVVKADTNFIAKPVKPRIAWSV